MINPSGTSHTISDRNQFQVDQVKKCFPSIYKFAMEAADRRHTVAGMLHTVCECVQTRPTQQQLQCFISTVSMKTRTRITRERILTKIVGFSNCLASQWAGFTVSRSLLTCSKLKLSNIKQSQPYYGRL